MPAPTTSSPDACTAAAKFPKLAAIITYLESLDRRADLKHLSGLLTELDVSKCDIAPCCVFGTKGYRRNTITESPWYELLALCWHSGDATPIHDHMGVSCAFKVVEGTGTEIRFRPTPSGLICPADTAEMQPGYVCAADDADIHQVANMQAPGTDLITLHIYSPPIKKMNTYAFANRIGSDVAACYITGSAEIPC